MKKVKSTIPVYDICSLAGNQMGMEIIAEPFASYLKAHPNLHLPHRHSFYHIVLFTKGAGYHSIDFERFAVRPGQLYFMKPGQVHSWGFEGETDGYIINFSERLFDGFLSDGQYAEAYSFFERIAAKCVVNLERHVYSSCEAIIADIVTEVKAHEPKAMDMVRAQLVRLFVTVGRIVAPVAEAGGKPHNQLVLASFRKLVDKYYAERRLPKDYAELLYITPNHLNALSKDLLGKPAGEVIRDRILLEAKRLLTNVDTSVADIGSQLNFTDAPHFSKFFKKYTGLTPEQFRKLSFDHHQ